jgi:hypothetical protein
MSPTKTRPTKAQLGTAAGSIGGGTTFVLFANQLPDTSIWKKLLLVSSPAVTYFLAKLPRLIMELLTELRNEFHLWRARKAINSYLKCPDISEEHRGSLRKRLENVELKVVDHRLHKLDDILFESEDFSKSGTKPEPRPA